MRSKDTAKGTRTRYTDTAAPIGDEDHTILLGREAVARASKVVKDWDRALSAMDENSEQYKKLAAKLEAFVDVLADILLAEHMLLKQRAKSDKGKAKC